MSSQILFTEAHWCSEGVVGFYYEHCGRRPVWVYVATVCKQIKYISASGAETAWHGKAIEDGELGMFVSIGQSSKHGVWFRDFHSPCGIVQDIVFQQWQSRRWYGRHRSGDLVVMTLLVPAPQAPQRPLSTAAEMSALEDFARDTQMLAIAQQEDWDDYQGMHGHQLI